MIWGCFLDDLGMFSGCFGGIFWMIWGCFLNDLVMFSGCFGDVVWMFWECFLDVFWRNFTNQATPCNPSVPSGGCKFADAETKNKCPCSGFIHGFRLRLPKICDLLTKISFDTCSKQVLSMRSPFSLS